MNPQPSLDKFDLIIGTGVIFKGDIQVDGRVLVSGQVNGSIQAKVLRIEPSGRVDGRVRVVDLDVKGWLGQDVTCTEALRVHHTGVVHGRLCCRELEIERGGRFTGTLIRPSE